jgi:ribonuclease P protein component
MYSFKKEERLCNVKLIEKLFTDGSSFLVYPFRIIWLTEPCRFCPSGAGFD